MGRLSKPSLASARHCPVASSTACMLSSTPKRILAGPAVPSPRTVPAAVAQAGTAPRAAAVDPEKK